MTHTHARTFTGFGCGACRATGGAARIYFYAIAEGNVTASWSRPITTLWRGGKFLPVSTASATSAGSSLGALVRWPAAAAGNTTITVRTAISFLSETDAAANLAAEQGGADENAARPSFDALRARFEVAWEERRGSRTFALGLRDTHDARRRVWCVGVPRTSLAIVLHIFLFTTTHIRE